MTNLVNLDEKEVVGNSQKIEQGLAAQFTLLCQT